ncbi:uncharacterized protein LOC126835267 [Adelges cooleyi]|uniref:uncharacterized protein LOC126835267 n=1 Tax=Adelges cooleyi TaxID=133065 RepID=UPI0021803E60|nr:uncharacterized protein LOC126835267 [Adelges cooleyi]XP_050423696.1 uncharacterized protein LOC126835267 [Adelges cooleyi]XP_050423697.1 uncharacterized protein LOC126835267 [Adelges cooleyi]
MPVSRTSNSSLSRWKIIVGVLSIVSLVHGHPVKDQELESAVNGVQKYLESSGFPKMTRGEVIDFLKDFSQGARVSRGFDGFGKHEKDSAVVSSPQSAARVRKELQGTNVPLVPAIPEGESPLNYGYPASLDKAMPRIPSTTTAPMIFVTVQSKKASTPKVAKTVESLFQSGADGKPVMKKSVGPPMDLNAYAKFKKIPEGRSVQIENVEMKTLLASYGLLDTPNVSTDKPKQAERRNDKDADHMETADETVLKSVLVETGNGDMNVSQIRPLFDDLERSSRDHVFNPSDSTVKTIDVNKIAKIVENIKLLADGNSTTSLSQDVIQKKLENITASIISIDEPSRPENASFTGYEVFFDDDTKDVDSDLPAGPPESSAPGHKTLNQAQNPPDPLSTDELQHLFEKNKNEFKRQEPENLTSTTTAAIASDGVPTTTVGADTSSEATSVEVTANSAVTDSSSEATSVEVSSVGSGSTVSEESARDSSTAAATDASPSLSQLAESFGGGETASNPPPPIDTEEPKSDRPRNGLYFYVDWNSFLTVNEGQSNQVNLRFAPKAGNPAHFFKVSVP